MHNYMRLLTSVELFRHLPQIVVTQLAGAVRSEIFMTNDVLVRAGTRDDVLYFIACGTVAIYNNLGKEVKVISDQNSYPPLEIQIFALHFAQRNLRYINAQV